MVRDGLELVPGTGDVSSDPQIGVEKPENQRVKDYSSQGWARPETGTGEKEVTGA
jgi:hypothetical protein